MHFSMYVYPWDLMGQGPSSVCSELSGLGIDTISLTSSYHAGRFVQPRASKYKTYFPEDGTVYFEPEPSLWVDHKIRPRAAAQLADEGNALASLRAQRDRGGLRVSCWTVLLHNTRLGLLHPEHVTRNAFGDPNYYSLCPSSMEVRRYARTLVQDLTAQYRPDVVELETPGFMGFSHGYHHEKDGVFLTAEEEFLLSICFCESCRSGALSNGIDADAASTAIRETLSAAFEREFPRRSFAAFPGLGIESFERKPELLEYLSWRSTVVTSLVDEIRQEAHSESSVIVISEIAAWREGIDLPEITRACDGLVLLGYGTDSTVLAESVGQIRSQIQPRTTLGVSLRPFYPEVSDSQELARLSVAAVGAGATSLHYYNYGLVPAARLAWIKAATGEVLGRLGSRS